MDSCIMRPFASAETDPIHWRRQSLLDERSCQSTSCNVYLIKSLLLQLQENHGNRTSACGFVSSAKHSPLQRSWPACRLAAADLHRASRFSDCGGFVSSGARSEEHTSELQSR